MFNYQKTEELVHKLIKSLVNDDWNLKINVDKIRQTADVELVFKNIKINRCFHLIEFDGKSFDSRELQDVTFKTLEYHIHKKVISELCKYFKKKDLYDLFRDRNATFEIKDVKFTYYYGGKGLLCVNCWWADDRNFCQAFYLNINSLNKAIVKQAIDFNIQEQLEEMCSTL